MFTNPELLPSDSHIWIYQSDRELIPEEEFKISEHAKSFIESWTAHQKDLRGSFEIRHHLFLILIVDENHESPSGCSIDKSLHFIQSLEKELNISFLNRQIFAIWENETVKLIGRKKFEEMLHTNEITEETIVFNNLITTKGELEDSWQVPLKMSWHGAIG
jgi:hypothetical protein